MKTLLLFTIGIITITTLVLALAYFVIKHINQPTFILNTTLKKQIAAYEINYEVFFEPTPGKPERTVLNVFSADNKLKTVQQYFKDEDKYRVIQNALTQFYFEIPQGNYSCFTPIFIDDKGDATPTMPQTCQDQTVAKDPFSTDARIIPTARINVIKNKLNNENLIYLGEKELINKKCQLFEADLKSQDKSASENIQYHNEIYKTVPNVAKITFCLDEQNAIALEMVIEFPTYTPNYGESGTKLTYKATLLNTTVYEKEFTLPAPLWTAPSPTPVSSD